MPLSDIELIQRTLAGDETAFGFLVDKYKGAVHALAYRKLGDFQLAEEIAQDTFLAAYQKLGTLKNRTQFPGWLYVIASRCCLMWQRKNRLQVHLKEDMETGEIDAVALRRHAEKGIQQQVRDALESLPESERTVLTLHYLAGMTSKEIGQFIGISPGAVLNRLYRARARLKEEIIPILRSTLGVIQLPPVFTEQLVRQIRDLQPTPAPSGKPVFPWIAATTLAVIVLFIGFGQQTTWFQPPYSLNAPESATMVDIVDAPMVENSTLQRPLFSLSASLNAGEAGNGGEIDDGSSGNAKDSARPTTAAHAEWTPMNGPYGGTILSLLVTQEGTVFAGTDKAFLFRSANGGESWTRVHTPLDHLPGQKRLSALTVIEDRLYAVGSYVVSSEDEGDSWIVDSRFEAEEDSYCGIAIVDGVLYVGSWQRGVLRSIDDGQTWTPINEGLTDSSNPQFENTQSAMSAHAINTFLAEEQTLYVGTDSGAFRRRAGDDQWEPLHRFIPTDVMSAVEQPVDVNSPSPTPPFSFVRSLAVEGEEYYIATLESLYHSSDGGTSWEEIPGTDFMRGMISSIAKSGKIIYVGEYVRGVFRSTDDGRSWAPTSAGITDSFVEDVEGLNGVIYAIKGFSKYNITRSKDGGTSWATIDDGLPDGIVGKVRQLVVSDGTLYAAFDGRSGLIYRREETTDSWLQVASHTQLAGISSLAVDGDVFYAGTCRNGVLRSTDGGESWMTVGLLGKRINVLAVHRMTIYAGTEGEGIFRLESGTQSWEQLGVSSSIHRVKELAVAGEILYAAGISRGARVPGDSGGTADHVINGVLRSFDGGDSWEKVSTGLEVEMGIISLAVRNSTLYAGAKTRVYRLLPGTDSWELISPKFPDMPGNVRCLGIEENTLYAGTGGSGVFKFSLNE